MQRKNPSVVARANPSSPKQWMIGPGKPFNASMPNIPQGSGKRIVSFKCHGDECRPAVQRAPADIHRVGDDAPAIIRMPKPMAPPTNPPMEYQTGNFDSWKMQRLSDRSMGYGEYASIFR